MPPSAMFQLLLEAVRKPPGLGGRRAVAARFSNGADSAAPSIAKRNGLFGDSPARRTAVFRFSALLLAGFSPWTALQAQNQATPYNVITFAGAAGSSGSADGAGTAGMFANPSDVAIDAAGNLYIADTSNHTVRKVTPPLQSNPGIAPPALGIVTTLAGQAGVSGSSDGSGTAASFNHPAGVAVDNSGNVYVADTNNNEIRKVTAAGFVSTLAGLTGHAGSADGSGPAASFNGPSGIVVDTVGNLFVADTLNHTIRKVTSSGAVTTIAGVAGVSGLADDTGSAARFHGPQGLALDASGDLFVADTNNNAIRKIVIATGVVTTVAGQAGIAGSADGSSSQAQFHFPSGVALDAAGNLFVADTDNHTLREITPSGIVSTLAGLAGSSGSEDGVGTAARFDFPTGISVDGPGNVYVADTNNDTVRIACLPGLPVISQQPQSVSVNPGDNATLSVMATGGPILYYNWYQNTRTVEGTTVTVDISGNRTINLTNVQAYNAGIYYVTATNSSGTVTSNEVQLTIMPAGGGGSSGGGDSSGGSGGGGGGGGTPSVWFYGMLSLLVLARRVWVAKTRWWWPT
jgi:sugar lactone lactonase YvrE